MLQIESLGFVFWPLVGVWVVLGILATNIVNISKPQTISWTGLQLSRPEMARYQIPSQSLQVLCGPQFQHLFVSHYQRIHPNPSWKSSAYVHFLQWMVHHLLVVMTGFVAQEVRT